MNTIVIWDQCGQDAIKFFVLKGDYLHLHEIYLGSVDNQEKQDELNELLSYDDLGQPKVKMVDKFPYGTYQYGDIVIVCGFIP